MNEEPLCLQTLAHFQVGSNLVSREYVTKLIVVVGKENQNGRSCEV